MKHDDFYDELADLALAYKKTPWWKPWRAHFLKKEINRRWHHFIREVCEDHEEDAR